MTDLSRIGGRLRYARRCRGYEHALIAKYTGVKPRTLRSYEDSSRATPYDLIRLLAYMYNVPIDWLAHGTGEIPCHPMSPGVWFMTNVLATHETALKARMRKRPWPAALPRASAPQMGPVRDSAE